MATTILLSLLVAAVPCVGDSQGEWIELLPGKDFRAWREPRGEWMMVGDVTADPADATRLTWTAGARVAVNGPRGQTVDLITAREFGDVEAHIEFMIPKGSNSGVYFMGRYEIQIFDSHGVAKDKYPGIECGGIYPRWINNQNVGGHSPRVNASLPSGQWQTFDVVFRAPRFDPDGKKIKNAEFVRVVHNGRVIHENVEVEGPTRSALYNEEKPTRSLMLQGDHGPVAYRHVRLRGL